MQYRSKKPLQDVVTKPGRVPPRTERPSIDAPTIPPRPRVQTLPRVEQTQTIEQYDAREEKEPTRWGIIALTVAIVIVSSAVGLSFIFTGATVTITPRTEASTIDTALIASLEPQGGELGFSWASQERTETRTLKAESESQFEERASGEITIYNSFSSQPLRLIKNTRFESPDGKIFKIRDSVVVPGMTKQGETSTPGELRVTVYADQTGDTYNIEAGSFTIPGFEGRPQYALVTAKSSTPFTGGFKGLRKTVDQEKLDEALQEMQRTIMDTLRTTLEQDVTNNPEVYLVKDSIRFTFEQLPSDETGKDEVVVSLKGVAYGVNIHRNALAKHLASQVVPGYDGSDVILENEDTFSLQTADLENSTASGSEQIEENATSSLPTTISLTIRGKISLLWTFEEASLRDDLAGKDTSIMDMPPDQTVMGKYPGIKSAHAVVRPFWKGSFPSDPADIKIITLLDS